MTGDETAPRPDVRRAGFERRRLCIEPGDWRAYEAADWSDSLVILESGQLELEATSGASRTFHGGDILWFAGLPLRRLVNTGDTAVVITAVRRR
jgi:hypothetical protein